MRATVLSIALGLVTMPVVADAQAWRGREPPTRYEERWARPDSTGWEREGARTPPRARCAAPPESSILGAIAGGLLGNAPTGRRERDVGFIGGAGTLGRHGADRDC